MNEKHRQKRSWDRIKALQNPERLKQMAQEEGDHDMNIESPAPPKAQLAERVWIEAELFAEGNNGVMARVEQKYPEEIPYVPEESVKRLREEHRKMRDCLAWIAAIEVAPPISWPHYLTIAKAANEALPPPKENK